jgi:hypothetical protein
MIVDFFCLGTEQSPAQPPLQLEPVLDRGNDVVERPHGV